jgi:hypothetical protein
VAYGPTILEVVMNEDNDNSDKEEEPDHPGDSATEPEGSHFADSEDTQPIGAHHCNPRVQPPDKQQHHDCSGGGGEGDLSSSCSSDEETFYNKSSDGSEEGLPKLLKRRQRG